MEHETLSVKLSELDDRVSRLHGKIHDGELMDHEILDGEISRAEKECIESRQALFDKLHHSQSKAVSGISRAYDCVEESIGRLMKNGDGDMSAEERILLAEYSLDFAILAAETALLKSLEAIKASRDEERSA